MKLTHLTLVLSALSASAIAAERSAKCSDAEGTVIKQIVVATEGTRNLKPVNEWTIDGVKVPGSQVEEKMVPQSTSLLSTFNADGIERKEFLRKVSISYLATDGLTHREVWQVCVTTNKK